MEHETFWSLLCSGPHWLFELFLMVLFDGVIGLVLWPCFLRYALHHKSDDDKTRKLEQQVSELRKLHGLEKTIQVSSDPNDPGCAPL